MVFKIAVIEKYALRNAQQVVNAFMTFSAHPCLAAVVFVKTQFLDMEKDHSTLQELYPILLTLLTVTNALATSSLDGTKLCHFASIRRN